MQTMQTDLKTAVDFYFESLADSENSTANVDGVIAELTKINGGILPLVESLQNELTSINEPKLRVKACGLLASVLDTCAIPVEPTQATVLVRFFCERLKDQSSVGESIRALIALQDVLDGEMAVLILRTIFAEITIQNFTQSVRGAIFRLFSVLLSRHLAIISEKMGSDFVVGFIQAVDNEKDPRNLLLAFRMTQWIVGGFPIAQLAEDLFEVVACYFPITFRPPPNDPFGITADDLRLELRKCMTGSQLFGPFAMPLLLEKLGSASVDARRDAIDTLIDGLPVYGIMILQENTQELWKLCQDMFRGSEADLVQPSTALIVAILRVLESRGQHITIANESGMRETLMETFLNQVYEDSMKIIQEGETKFAKVYGQALISLAKSNSGTCSLICRRWIPILLKTYGDVNSSFSQRRQIIEYLCELLSAIKDTLDGQAFSGDHPIITLKSSIIETLLLALTADDVIAPVKRTAFVGLRHMVQIPNLVNEEEMRLFLDHDIEFLRILKSASAATETVALLDAIADRNSSLVEQIMFPYLNGMLENFEESWAVPLYTIKKLTAKVDLTVPIVKLVCDLCLKAKNAAKYPSKSIEILRTLKDIVADGEMPAEAENDIMSLLTTLVENVDEYNIDAVADLFSVCTRKLGSIRSLLVRIVSDFCGGRFAIAPIFVAVVGNLRSKDFECLYSCVPEKTLEAFIFRIWELSRSTRTSSVQSCVAQAIGSIINKLASDELAYMFEPLVSTINDRLTDATDGNGRHAAAALLLWMTKALVLLADKRSNVLLDRCVQLIDDQQLGSEVADGFAIIAGNMETIFSKSSFAKVKILYRQRLFCQAIPLLESRYRTSPTDRRHLYLVAVSHVLRNTPGDVLFTGLGPLMPMLFSSIECESETDLVLSTLRTLDTILRESPSTAVAHASTLINSCLRLAQPNANGQPTAVRLAALRCLSSCASFPYQVIYPHKSKVVQDLIACLDDPKRAARDEAVHCRNKWFLQQ